MPDTFAIDIFSVPNASSGQPKASFRPTPATVSVGNVVFFRNNDEHHDHWPVASTVPNLDPKNPDRTGWWMDSPISKKLHNDPAVPSKQAFTPSVATPAAGVQYICALHPNEKGIVIVS